MRDKDDKEPTHVSGQHKLGLKVSASDPPVVNKKDGNGDLVPEHTIDQEKLLKAWSAMTGVNEELIRVVEKNEADNERTRASSKRTRRVIFLTCAAMLVGTGIHTWQIQKISRNTSTRTEHLHSQGQTNHSLMKEVSQDVKETLQAVRATAEAVGAQVEADATNDPEDVQDAQKKALQAQAAALDAEAKAEHDPVKKAEAGRKLERVKAKARRRSVKIEVDSGSFTPPTSPIQSTVPPGK